MPKRYKDLKLVIGVAAQLGSIQLYVITYNLQTTEATFLGVKGV